jgi:cytidine deaminase
VDSNALEVLLAHAREAAERAHAPYSKFRVGAAVRDADGQIFTGCNVESASYGLTMCAERNAIFAAVAAGAKRPFKALALTCLDATAEGGCMPCGACRQIISEHLSADAPVLVDRGGEYRAGQLLPFAFTLAPPQS